MKILFLALSFTLLSACAEVGSERWCKNMAEKPKAEWSTNEARDYAKNCIFESNDDE
jgi:hypothetical protein